MSTITINRKTSETDIQLKFKLYGKGKSQIHTGIGFLDHMLELFTFHGGFDLEVSCKGDLEVDGHHTVEDVGIVLGMALKKVISKEKRLQRYASCFVPMDESLARAVVDISGRPYLVFHADFRNPVLGTFDTELTKEFFQALVNHAQITLHLTIEYGENTHHKIEALFKAAGIALREAATMTESGHGPSSTKGLI